MVNIYGGGAGGGSWNGPYHWAINFPIRDPMIAARQDWSVPTKLVIRYETYTMREFVFHGKNVKAYGLDSLSDDEVIDLIMEPQGEKG